MELTLRKIREGGVFMRKVTCASCGRPYDYDSDDFCPKCGSRDIVRIPDHPSRCSHSAARKPTSTKSSLYAYSMEKTSFLKESVGGQSIVNKIVDNITNAIINGELNPGDKIPTEAELSESMGVGRNSVREAIKVLEAYGVVHIKRAASALLICTR